MKSNIEFLYEQLRKETDGGSESMTHDDAIEIIRFWRDAYYAQKHPQPKQEPVKDRLDFWALIDENQRLRAELKFNTAAQPQPVQELAEYDHGAQAETLAEAERDVRKWLNERPNRPLDLRHVAMLAYHAQQSIEQKPAVWNEVTPDFYISELSRNTIRYHNAVHGKQDFSKKRMDDCVVPVWLTAPYPQREWVDLPPEEIKALANLPGADRERTAVEMAYAVQAKLREKNGGTK